MNYKSIRTGGQLLLAAILLITIITTTIGQNATATVPYVNTRVDTTSSGAQLTDKGVSGGANVTASSDGQYVLFASLSSQLVSGDTNNRMDWFVKDTELGTVTRADVANGGSQLIFAQAQTYAKISANGRYVVFGALNVNHELPGNNTSNVYVRDLHDNTTELISQSTTGVAADSASYTYSNNPYDISADGRYVVFSSDATNLVPDDTNGYRDTFLRDRKLHTTTILSNTDTGAPSNSNSDHVTISCDGAYVAFESSASNLVTGDPNTHYSIYLIDRPSGNTIQDITPNANGSAGHEIALSCDGGTLLFSSSASNLVANDTNGIEDLFTYHLDGGTVERVNVSSDGQQEATYAAISGDISFNGRYVAFLTPASNLVSDDTNNVDDVFIRDLDDETTQRVDIHSDGTQTTKSSYVPFITEDGREVLYASDDIGLVPNDTNTRTDVFTSQTGY